MGFCIWHQNYSFCFHCQTLSLWTLRDKFIAGQLFSFSLSGWEWNSFLSKCQKLHIEQAFWPAFILQLWILKWLHVWRVCLLFPGSNLLSCRLIVKRLNGILWTNWAKCTSVASHVWISLSVTCSITAAHAQEHTNTPYSSSSFISECNCGVIEHTFQSW